MSAPELMILLKKLEKRENVRLASAEVLDDT